MRKSILVLAAGLAALSSAASAEMYKDYAPKPGVWTVTQMEVDPNHVEDYLTGLKNTMGIGFDVAKARGLIDDWWILVRNGSSTGKPTVLIGQHYTSAAAMMPDKARDQAIDKEIYARFAKTKMEGQVAEYEKYRKIIDDSSYIAIDFTK